MVIFSQPCTCCPPSSFMEAATKSIKDSPSNTFEHHKHFHLPMSHSNTISTSYHINIFTKCNNTRLAGLDRCRGQTGRQTLIFTLYLRIDNMVQEDSNGQHGLFYTIFYLILWQYGITPKIRNRI